MDLSKLAADIAAKNKAARDKSMDIAGRMAQALSLERYKYFDGLLDDESGLDGSPEGDSAETPGSTGEDGAMDLSGGLQLDAGLDETPGSQ